MCRHFPERPRKSSAHCGADSGTTVALPPVMKLRILAFVVCGCGNLSAPPPPALPWIHGFTAVGAGAVESPAAAQHVAELSREPEAAYGALELRGDLVGDGGTRVVLASYRAGVIVLDTEGRVAASAPGFAPAGSADELVAIAFGDGQLGAPLVLAAVQSGGHRENAVSLAVYRFEDGALEQVFFAPVETHDGDNAAVGAVMFVPSGLAYRAPGADVATMWTYDAKRRRYVQR